MKKLMLLLLFVLCGCMPQPTLRDASCSQAKTIRVIHVDDDVILGWADIKGSESLYSHKTYYRPTDEHYVYLKRNPRQIYYPGQILRVSDKVCLKYIGSYSYRQKGLMPETVLTGYIDEGEYPNPEYEALMQKRYEKAKTSCWMRRRLGKKCDKK